MSEPRRTKLQEETPNLKIEIEGEPNLQDKPLSPEEAFLRRKAEVTQQDHEEFLKYQEEKNARDQQAAVQPSRRRPRRSTGATS